MRLSATTLSVIVALSTVGGCAPSKKSAAPEDYLGLVQAALAASEIGSMIGRNEAISSKDFAGCVSAETMISALQAAQEVVGKRVSGEVVFPGLNVSLSDCMEFHDPDLVPADPNTAAMVEGLVGVGISMARSYAEKVKLVSCEQGAVVVASLDWLAGMTRPIADEVANPDGVLAVPSVTVELEECVDQ